MKGHSFLLLIEIENWLIIDHMSAKKLTFGFLWDTLYINMLQI